MCSYTQVVIVTHRSPVIPCQRLMFRSSQVIFLFFLFSFIQLVDFCDYCVSSRCFDARVPRCHSQNFGEPHVLNNMNRFTAFCNPFCNCASQLCTGRLNEGPTLFSECCFAHSTLTPLDNQRMHSVEVVLKADIATVKRYRLPAECAYHFGFIQGSIFVFF